LLKFPYKMKKDHKIVLDAEQDVLNEITPKVYRMLGMAQKLQLIQEKLPTKPLFSTAQIGIILRADNE